MRRNVSMFALVNLLLRPASPRTAGRAVSIWRTTAANPHELAYFDLYRDYVIWTDENRTLRAVGATFEQEYAVTGAGDPVRVHGAIVTWNLFDVVGSHWSASNWTVGADPARRRLGGAFALDVVGALWV